MYGTAIAALFMLSSAAPCPDVSRVHDALSRSAPQAVRARHRWTVAVSDAGMKVTLLDVEGRVVRERVVPAPATCAERETVAAAVLAAWMVATPAAPEPPAPVVVKPPPPPPPPAKPRAPEPEPQSPPTPDIPRAVEPPPPAEEPLKAAPEETAPPPPAPPNVFAEPPLPPPEPNALRIEVGLDARAQLAESLAPGVGLMLSLGDRFGGFLEASTAVARTLSLPPGQVRWFRVAVGLGVRYRFDLRELYVEPAVSVEGALVRAEGQGFNRQNSVAWGPDLSACAALRAGRYFGDHVGAYVGARGCAWPLDNRVGATGVNERVSLPKYELAAVLGVSVGFAVKGSGGSGPSEK